MIPPTRDKLGALAGEPRDGRSLSRFKRSPQQVCRASRARCNHLVANAALPHQLNDKPRDMAFRHEVLHIRRQKQRLINIPGTKIFAHGPRLNQTRSGLNSDYSDRLLGASRLMEVQAVTGGESRAQQEYRPKAASVVSNLCLDQAASAATLRRRYVMKPTPAKPRTIIAQVEGSGTAVSTTLSQLIWLV